MEILQALFALQDKTYQQFQCRLMPTVDPAAVIGVPMPALRKLAKSLYGTPEAEAFCQTLPHPYYEENNLHGLLLCQIRSYEQLLPALEAFLPYVDNWATCDLLSPRAFSSHPPQLPAQLHVWMGSAHPYTARFGVGMLMRWYLDAAFDPVFLQWVAAMRSEEYYVNMMLAWYFATALAKQYDAALPFLCNRSMDRWVHNKTIQKAVESNRISAAQKTYLRTLRWKE